MLYVKIRGMPEEYTAIARETAAQSLYILAINQLE